MDKCWICSPQYWRDNQHRARHPVSFTELSIWQSQLHAFLAAEQPSRGSGPELRQLVELLTGFNGLRRQIIDDLIAYHTRNCYECTTCHRILTPHGAKQAKLTSRAIPRNLDYSEPVCYYLDLTVAQYRVMTRIADCGAEILAIEAMVGMEQIKHEFAGWIKYFSSVSAFSAGTEPMMHIAIYGPPGHGKTRIARLLGRAFAKSGLLSEPDLFVTASRANLIGRYCGETAIKTTERFDEARGGVIFVDEVYSLGNPEKRDVFTKECIDTINQLLSERTDTLCIIAGYEKEVEESFFSYNPGLARRFPFRFVLPVYSKAELVKIFYRLAEEKKMDIQPLALVAEDLLDLDLPNGGGDMDNLLNKAMIAHQAANFLQPVPHPDINRKEVEIALTQFKTHLHAVKTDPPPPGMYS